MRAVCAVRLKKSLPSTSPAHLQQVIECRHRPTSRFVSGKCVCEVHARRLPHRLAMRSAEPWLQAAHASPSASQLRRVGQPCHLTPAVYLREERAYVLLELADRCCKVNGWQSRLPAPSLRAYAAKAMRTRVPDSRDELPVCLQCRRKTLWRA